ncbi:MAG TPA: class I adenylate-forming enzyme family protein [Stellaceae bacterium]|nr:class I adenylate-forming enzyme family protein [Stellaceae bacterium]
MAIDAIYRHARSAPDRPAVVYNNIPLSYRRFVKLIDASRRYLLAQDLGSEGVAVVMIASILDAWILGLALRSLGLTTVVVRSPDQIAPLRLPNLRCVVTTEADRPADIAAACAEAGWRCVVVPRAAYAGAALGPPPPVPTAPTPHGGHVLLTSGTTGFYKKFLVDPVFERASIILRNKVLGVSRRTVVNVFDFGGWTGVGYIGPVATWDGGGCVVIFQGPRRYEAFGYRGITDALITPDLLTKLLAAPANALRRDDKIRLLVTGGALSPALWQETKSRLTSRVYTYLGATEAAVIAVTPIRQVEDLRFHRLVNSRTVEIVDEAGRLVPRGQIGLIRIGTIGGIKGYFGDEEASRASFRDGYFYPGDLGAIGPDGRLVLQGRASAVVNIQGNKLAAEPVEAALESELHIAGVCVFSMQHDDGEEIVHLAIEAPQPLPSPDIEAALRRFLPGAYRAQIHFVDALPRNDMGKIQRDALKRRLNPPG